jgi:hypothetical protein
MDWYTCIILLMVLSEQSLLMKESALWTKSLASSAINAFDVFRPSFQDPSISKEPPSLVLIRQPPSPFFHKPIGGGTTFLNTTEDGAWYALSTDRYPLLTSRVQPAPWVSGTHEDGNENATKEDLIGIHPVARTVEINTANPGLPASTAPKLIEGGDWQSGGHEQMGLIKESPLFILAALGIFLLILWRRHILPNVSFGRGTSTVVKDVLDIPVEIYPVDPVIELLVKEDAQIDTQEETKVDIIEVQENDEAAATVDKKPRRKRGQRGGKNNKKKVGFVEPTTDVDEEDHGELDGSGFVKIASSKEIPKDIPVNDQGNHAIDGLIVTDKLLGI